MAAKLPTSIVDGPVRGTRPSTATVDYSGYGEALGSAAKALTDVAQAYDARDQDNAKKALVAARTSFDPAFSKAADDYDGLTPGFAQAQSSAYDQATAAVREGLSANAKLHFDQLNLPERLNVVDRASSVESAASAAIVKRQRAADAQSRAIASGSEHQVETQAALRDAFVTGDPTSPDFMPQQLADFDDRAKARLEAAAPEVKPILTGDLANQRANLVSSIAAGSRGLLDLRVLQSSKVAITALQNGVNADPTTLGSALARAPQVLSGLPQDVQTKMLPQVQSDLASASLKGLVDREDWDGIDKALKDPLMKRTLTPEAFQQFQARTTQALTSQQRLLAGDTVSRRLESELASIRETGQGTGFDADASAALAVGPVQAPAKAAEWKQQIADAKTVHDLTRDFSALPAKDQEARLALIKPAAGDPDFAHKQAVYDTAVAIGQKQAQLRLTDPAQALLADKTASSLWMQAQDGDPTHARAWASDALARQAALGIAPDAQRILPSAEAKRVVSLAAGKDAAGKAEALSQIFSYAKRFGDGNDGRVLFELQRAGLPTDEAAVLNGVDGDPVVVAAYARAQARSATAKLEKPEKDAVEASVTKAMKPLVATYANSPEGMAYADALSHAVTTMTTAGVADGKPPQRAADEAAKWFLNRFSIDPRGGWRMPGEIASRQGLPIRQTFVDGGEQVSKGDGAKAVRAGAENTLGEMAGSSGVNLWPQGSEAYLTTAQKQRRVADLVAHNGRWVTTGDDGGLMLTVPDPRAGAVPVLDKGGKPIMRTWEQLIDRAGKKGAE